MCRIRSGTPSIAGHDELFVILFGDLIRVDGLTRHDPPPFFKGEESPEGSLSVPVVVPGRYVPGVFSGRIAEGESYGGFVLGVECD